MRLIDTSASSYLLGRQLTSSHLIHSLISSSSASARAFERSRRRPGARPRRPSLFRCSAYHIKHIKHIIRPSNTTVREGKARGEKHTRGNQQLPPRRFYDWFSKTARMRAAERPSG